MEELLIICRLVRMSIFGTEEEIPAGVNWPKIFTDAGVNGVSAICYEAVKRLPSDRQPDFDLLLCWDVSSQGLREGYRQRHEVTRELQGMLAVSGVDMLLLKGETLASNYPQPELRESGDVDFVALKGRDSRSGFAACNAVVESCGIGLQSQEKHSGFCYHGVHFENHTLEPTGGYNSVHHRTFALLKESLPDAVRRGDGCLELPPVMQAVFVVKHTAQHLCYSGGRIALRMLLDLALLLQRHPEIPDVWKPALRQTGLDSFAPVLLCAADQLFGTSFCKDCSRSMQRRTSLFIRLFLTDSNRAVRYFAKFAFLPLSEPEILRIIGGKLFGRHGK